MLENVESSKDNVFCLRGMVRILSIITLVQRMLGRARKKCEKKCDVIHLFSWAKNHPGGAGLQYSRWESRHRNVPRAMDRGWIKVRFPHMKKGKRSGEMGTTAPHKILLHTCMIVDEKIEGEEGPTLLHEGRGRVRFHVILDGGNGG